MNLLITLIVGLVIGVLAKLVMPGKDPGGILITMLLGVAGAFIAGMLCHSLGWYTVGGDPDLVASVVGAVILLGLYRMIARPRRTW